MIAPRHGVDVRDWAGGNIVFDQDACSAWLWGFCALPVVDFVPGSYHHAALPVGRDGASWCGMVRQA